MAANDWLASVVSDRDRLFPDNDTRPPGVPDNAQPGDVPHNCPECGARSFYWRRLTYAHCDWCHYVWQRSGQLHHSEKLPF